MEQILVIISSLFLILSSFNHVNCFKVPLESVLPNDPVTVCYVSTWAVYRPDQGRFGIEDLDPNLCTHLVYAFAGLNASTGTIKSLDPYNDLEEDYGKGTYKKMTSLKSQNPRLKVTLAIGGWNEGSENYSALAASPAKREKFVESVVAFLKRFEFDGLDLDWEYPGMRGGKPEDKANFVTLIQELRREMDKHGWILTAAIGASKATIDVAYDLPALSKYLDFIHLMGYDYHGSWDLQVGANAPLTSYNKSDTLTVEYSVKYLLANGVSPNKLVLGLPMYGRTFILEDPQSKSNKTETKGFRGPFTREDGFLGYNEICTELIENSSSWHQWFDEETKTAFARNNEKVIAFDNRRSLNEKVKLAATHHLAGVMVWSMDTDDFHGNCNEKEEVGAPDSMGKSPLLKLIRTSLVKYYSEEMENQRKKDADKHDQDNNVVPNPNGATAIISQLGLSLSTAILVFTSLLISFQIN